MAEVQIQLPSLSQVAKMVYAYHILDLFSKRHPADQNITSNGASVFPKPQTLSHSIGSNSTELQTVDHSMVDSIESQSIKHSSQPQSDKHSTVSTTDPQSHSHSFIDSTTQPQSVNHSVDEDAVLEHGMCDSTVLESEEVLNYLLQTHTERMVTEMILCLAPVYLQNLTLKNCAHLSATDVTRILKK